MLIGQQIGPFVIEKELGSGAMGTVYRATFHKDDKAMPVALKVVALGLLGNEGAMARFDREATILKQLRHPHIVRLIATGRYRSTPFIAMEYIEGEPLDRALSRKGRLTWEEVAAHAKQLCAALQYAHEKGIIHRDLKPSNLMVTRDGVLKLTDFGIAKDQDVTALTGANSTIGTAAYMSPEQCKGDRNLTAKSDLYSLGVCLFELLTGRKPFVAENTVEMFLKHVHEEPPRPGNLVPDLPPKFEMLILQLMAKDKDERPVDAAWVMRMLGEIEEDAYARKSAGLEAATSRRGDRSRGDGAIDEDDRDAALALRGKKRKKKKRAAVGPWYQQQWAKAAGILLLLAGMGVGVYFAVKPPSAAALYAAVESAKSPDDKHAAAEKYLTTYGEKKGEKTDAVATIFRDTTIRKQEDVLAKRFRNNLARPDDSEDKEAYASAWEAMQAEKAGQLETAAAAWGRVKAKFPEEAKLPFALKEDVLLKARWGWIAEKRLKEIKTVEGRLAKLRRELDEKRTLEIAIPTDPATPDSLATRALRLGDLRDAEKAARVWAAVAALNEKGETDEQRTWVLLASQQRAVLGQTAEPAKAAAQRLADVRTRLNQAGRLAGQVKGNPEQRKERAAVRHTCRDVIELYDDDPDLAGEVNRAKQILAEVPKA